MSSPLLLLFYLRLKLCFYFPLNDIFIVKTKILNVTPPIHETRNTGTGKGMWGMQGMLGMFIRTPGNL